ncbi:ATP-binding cassette domain-containing protein [Paroceanicella profunda]|uniref:ATP-binding cassette domain-containing protein n=1 Tax=Paroceanicella profunda TaxID=2579971 RepID=A0A5B8FXP3_9RHOB|nr:ATP-binding cassette domain-containing protein [Paroceanicella profunda]QDL91319.1 ATP-binding cassette domain-containing protein [Paroceanicella profunda]
MDRTLLQFVWRSSWRDQLIIVLASLISFPIILSTLYIPKIIVDEALRGTEFPQSFLGFQLDQIDYLIALCGTLLVLIILNNAVKYFINVQKGLTGERLLRRLRYVVFERVTLFPLPRLRNTSPGEVVQIVAAEVEPIGGFAGEMVATPVYQGGQLLVYMGFILAQDPFLGLAAIFLFPVQAYVVPKVQRVVVRLVQKRIRNVRSMTAEISEAVGGMEAMRINDAREWHLARMSERLYTNFRIRYRIFLLKYAIKFANNVVNNITPFFFYSFGGYLVIQGRMELGALVAILAAYKDIASPWRELLNYYQSFSDISARYDAVYDAYGRERLVGRPDPVRLGEDDVVLEGIFSDQPVESGGVEDVSLTIRPGQTMVVLGEEEGGRTVLLKLLSGLALPSRGAVRVGSERGRDVLTRAYRDLAYVSRAPHILSGTFRENVAYSLLGQKGHGEKPEDWARREREARLTGATPEDPEMDWVDYQRIGLDGAEAFDAYVLEILGALGLTRELFIRGLWTRLDPKREPLLAEQALAARQLVARDADAGLAGLVEAWDRDAYLENATLAENLFYGVPDSPKMRWSTLARRPDVRKALVSTGMEEEVLRIGLEAAELLVELLGSLGRDGALVEQLGLIDHSEIEDYARIVAAQRRRSLRWLSRGDRVMLMRLAFEIAPLRHRLGVLDSPERRARIVKARRPLRARIEAEGWLHYFDDPGYLPGLPLIENVLGGRPRIDRRDATPPVEQRLGQAMLSHDIHQFVIAAGLRTNVGLAGSTLSPSQARRVALARALAAKPSVLVLDGVADDSSDNHRALREAMEKIHPGGTRVFGTQNEALARDADIVIRISRGKVVAVGAPSEIFASDDAA